MRSVRLCLGAALAYFLAVRLGYAWMIPPGIVTLWPPAGVMLAVLVLAEPRSWPPLVTGALLGSLAADTLEGLPLHAALMAAVANLVESLLAAAFVRWRFRLGHTLSTLHGVLEFVGGAVVACCAVVAVLGTPAMLAGYPARTPGSVWLAWWIGDGVSMLVIAPAIILWADAGLQRARPAGRVVEAAVIAVVLGGIAFFSLGPGVAGLPRLRPYAVFPALLWATLRFGPLGAANGSLLLAAAGVWNASRGFDLFGASEIASDNAAFELLVFLTVATLSVLIPGAILEERRATRDRLLESQERYRSVVEAATDAIITIDERSRIQFANPATERVFGYTPAELSGQQITLLMPEQARERHRYALQRYVATGERGIEWSSVSLAGQRKDGREVPLEVSFGELRERGRHIFTGVLRDVSDKRAAEQALKAIEEQSRQSQKMEAIGRLAGGVAHDFNNLLTAINGYAAFVADSLPPDSPTQLDVREIVRASGRAASLTAQLLAYSRQQIMEPRVLDLGEAVDAMTPMLRRLIGEDIEIRVRTAADLGKVHADPGQMEQVVLNLALNARDAMPDGGRLQIELTNVDCAVDAESGRTSSPAGPCVLLVVSDTGMGMDADMVSRVFEPFFTTKALGKGTGLGLSMVHGIVRQSGGSIEVQSERGRGASFKVYLPRVEAVAEEAAPREAVDERPVSESVLVVEDDDALRALIGRILTGRGYGVRLAATPAEALDLVARQDDALHLLVADVVLPGINGRALAETVLARRPHIRILFMSGYTDDAVVRRGVLEHETHFLQKPFSGESLLGKVRDALDDVRAPAPLTGPANHSRT